MVDKTLQRKLNIKHLDINDVLSLYNIGHIHHIDNKEHVIYANKANAYY